MNKSGSACCLADVGLLAMRLMLAVVFVYHGGQKLLPVFGGPVMPKFTEGLTKMHVPRPEIAAQLSAFTELVGGVLLGVGFLTRLVAIPMAFNMYVAALVFHAGAFSLGSKGTHGLPGMEYPLTLAVFFTALILTGPGRLSVDGLLFRRRCCEKPAPAAVPPPKK